jgi:hypothetical protein
MAEARTERRVRLSGFGRRNMTTGGGGVVECMKGLHLYDNVAFREKHKFWRVETPDDVCKTSMLY